VTNTDTEVTTIQSLLGHRVLVTTQVHACVHDQTVADDYFTAMAAVEENLAGQLPGESADAVEKAHYSAKTALLTNLDTLRAQCRQYESGFRLERRPEVWYRWHARRIHPAGFTAFSVSSPTRIRHPFFSSQSTIFGCISFYILNLARWE